MSIQNNNTISIISLWLLQATYQKCIEKLNIKQSEIVESYYREFSLFSDDDSYYNLSGVEIIESENYFRLIYQAEYKVTDNLTEIQSYIKELLDYTVFLLDKYSGNQDGDLNLRFILMQYQTINSIENKLELTKEQKGELYTRLFNPNIFNAVNLLGILAGNERLEYLEYYKQANWIELIKLITSLYNKNMTRIDKLIPVLEECTGIRYSYDNLCGWLSNSYDGAYYLEQNISTEIDPAYNYSRGLKQYLIIFDLLVIRLKHNYESKVSDSNNSININKANSFSLSDLVLILSSHALIDALSLTTSQISQLEGFLLNLEFDGEQVDGGVIFDNERWQFIYHWIDQMRAWLVKNG